MKKVILSLLSFALIAGCSGYDYYKTNVRYRQVGNNCVYYYNEKGKEFNDEIRNLKDAKKIVYRDVRCEDLYGKDTFGYPKRSDRKVFVPAAVEEGPVFTPKCGYQTCGKKQVMASKYVVVPAYAG